MNRTGQIRPPECGSESGMRYPGLHAEVRPVGSSGSADRNSTARIVSIEKREEVYMDRIEIRDFSSEREKQPQQPWMALLFLISGVLGILFFLENMRGISFSLAAVCSFSAGLCALFWFSFYRSRRIFVISLLTLTAVVTVTSVLLREMLRTQLAEAVAAAAAGTGDAALTAEGDMTEFMLLFSAILVLLLFGLECVIRSHGILYLLTTALLLLSTLLGIGGGAESFVLLVVFQAGFFILRAVEQKHRRSSVTEEDSRRIGKKSGIAAALVIAVSFAAAVPASVFFSEELSNGVYEAEGFVVRSFRNLSGRASDPVAGGLISRGNNYRTGAEQLELSASEQPSEILYLKGFAGGDYIGGEWLPADDEAVFRDMAEEMHWRGWEDWIAGAYDNMYFDMNRNILPELPGGPAVLLITHSNGDYRQRYQPYYSRWSRGWIYGDSSEADGYRYLYYEQEDMRTDWENVRPDMAAERSWYRQLQAAYMNQIETVYTRVPSEILPRLSALVEANPLTDTEEITAFILYTLHSSASYSLTPGRMPRNGEDVAEYFLFEGHSGYCVHFAAAATLMYRLYGIPARYVSGYAASPEDFTQQEDGSWRAVLTDEAAHAWTEIFLPGYGWTPVEVTPSASGDMTASYPGFDGSALERLMEENSPQAELPDVLQTEDIGPSQRSEEDGGDADPEETADRGTEDTSGSSAGLYFASIAAVAGVICLIACCRRRRILRRLEQADCREIFFRFTEMLKYCKILKNRDGIQWEGVGQNNTQEEFPENAAEKLIAVSGVSGQEIDRMSEIVRRKAYGPEAACAATDAEERAFVLGVYRKAAAGLYEKLPGHKKLYFRFIAVFL